MDECERCEKEEAEATKELRKLDTQIEDITKKRQEAKETIKRLRRQEHNCYEGASLVNVNMSKEAQASRDRYQKRLEQLQQRRTTARWRLERAQSSLDRVGRRFLKECDAEEARCWLVFFIPCSAVLTHLQEAEKKTPPRRSPRRRASSSASTTLSQTAPSSTPPVLPVPTATSAQTPTGPCPPAGLFPVLVVPATSCCLSLATDTTSKAPVVAPSASAALGPAATTSAANLPAGLFACHFVVQLLFVLLQPPARQRMPQPLQVQQQRPRQACL